MIDNKSIAMIKGEKKNLITYVA